MQSDVMYKFISEYICYEMLRHLFVMGVDRGAFRQSLILTVQLITPVGSWNTDRSMAIFILSYEVGCRKENTSQGWKVQKKYDAALLIKDDCYLYLVTVKYSWRMRLSPGPKGPVTILKEKRVISFFCSCTDILGRYGALTWLVI